MRQIPGMQSVQANSLCSPQLQKDHWVESIPEFPRPEVEYIQIPLQMQLVQLPCYSSAEGILSWNIPEYTITSIFESETPI